MSQAEYIWHEPGRPISIHLSLDVVSRLGLAAMEAYESVPRRGLEVGGLLLGRHEGSTIYIDGLEPVESEHRSGLSDRLSESDIQIFREARQQHPEAVGMYRTQTGPDSLSLQLDDAEIFGYYLSGPDDIYLLVQPATGRAAFFLPENGTLALAHEFPFRACELVADVREEETAAAPAFVPTAVAPEIPATPPRRRFRWLVPLAAVVLGMATGAVQIGRAH